MNHQEYINIVPDASTAFIFIHGIVGSPNHFDDFVPLVPKEYSIYNILLDGHGKTAIDFAKTNMSKWQNQVDKLINEVEKTHDNIYIIAHSMGTLLTMSKATSSSKIKGMFFLAPPLKIILKPSMILTSLKIYFNRIKPSDIRTNEAKRCYSINHTYNIISYLRWIPRFLDLFKKARQTRKITNKILIPTYVYISKKDEVVSRKSKKYLQSNYFKVYTLNDSRHFYYDYNDKLYLLEEFKKFIKNK